MKQYLKALQEYEKRNNRFALLCRFMALKNSNLTKQYRDGTINLPSFLLIKQLHAKYSDLTNSDEELNNLFLNAKECSKLFYSKTLSLINVSKRSGNDFDLMFSKEAQPLGQRLINILTNIKFRIRVARLKRQTNQNGKFGKILRRINSIVNPITCWVNNIVYKASLIQSAHHRLTKKLYYIAMTAAIFSLITMNYLLLDKLPFLLVITSNVFSCLLLSIGTIIMRPLGDFGKIDISGENIIAYKYKVFFNNQSNKKIYNIFTVQHTHEPRHNNNQSIDSTECETST
jgi:hypothetical protein